MRKFLPLLLVIFSFTATAQEAIKDTVLNEVIIEAYTAGRPLLEVPASVGNISEADLNRFSNTNLLPAVNTIPGVRMEERSPGSYRFSIRGSLLRSPFGVRNVKFYLNGLPFTDGGGNTYLNLLDLNSIGNIQVIKGPAGSLYGAGTGGVVLLKSPLVKNDQLHIGLTAGSLGLKRLTAGGQLQTDKVALRFHYAHQESDGYREQTAMKRDVLNGDITFLLNRNATLTTTLLYSDLFYETPGGLTKGQFEADPKQARPPGGPNKGAVEQQAAVRNRTPYVGFTYDQQWNDAWSSQLAIFGSASDFTNAAIANFEERDEKNFGVRNENSYSFNKAGTQGKVTIGAEWQSFNSTVGVHGNRAGEKDTVQTSDDLSSRLLMVFSQADLMLPADFVLTLGASINSIRYDLTRTYPSKLDGTSNFNLVFSPRIALLKKISEKHSVYANVSNGFSPPSLAEVLPSSGVFSLNLNAERGMNYEFGFRGSAMKFYYDVCFYNFRLDETIVQRRQDNGAEYFINAGRTSQRGIETMISWAPLQKSSSIISDLKVWTSYNYNHYRFRNFASDTENFSGKKLTGIPPTVATGGLDLGVKQTVYFNITANYVDHIPLNDANTVFAEAYFLLGARATYRTDFKNNKLEIFGGVDNLTDEVYSLGNDLNAFGGRYFNTAPPRNFYAGLRYDLSFQ